MSTNKVDERVVEMSFDNKKFEKGISESSSSLSKFDSQLEKSGNSSGLTGLAGVVEGVSTKFSALGTIGVGALLEIGRAAVNLGANLVKSVAIDPVMQGFNEYELKINSIRTMLASGKTKEGLPVTLAEVNTQLDALNTYADKTIYSFADMTSNIGKFTNAGVNLKSSVEAIKGISNEAALSGANAEEASRAMYNFAQALSAGYVKLIDWKSIENANMATVEFKQYLLDAAVAAGTVTKSANGMYTVLSKNNMGKTMKETVSATSNFNDSLQYQWMTTKVLTDTLADYASETTTIGKKANEAATKVRTFSQLMDTTKEAVGSGWTESFELLIGNYDQATNFWTGLSNVIGNFVQTSSDSRNKVLSDWAKLGGRTDLIEGIKAAFEALDAVIKPIHDAFVNIFPPLTGKQLADVSKGFRGLMESLKMGPDASAKIQKAFEGLFSVVKFLMDGFRLLTGFGWDIGQKVFPIISTGAMDAGSKIGTFLSNLSNGIGPIQNFKLELKDLGPLFDQVKDFVYSLIHGKDTVQAFAESFSGIQPSTKNASSGLVDLKQTFQDNMDNIQNFVTMIQQKLLPAFDWIKDKISDISLKQIASIVLGLGMIKIGKTILEVIKPFSEVFDGFSGILGSITKTIKTFSLQIKANALLTIAKAIAILTGSLIALALVPADKLVLGLQAISTLMAELVIALVILNKMQNPLQTSALAAALSALSGGIFLLSGALIALGLVPFNILLQGLGALTALMAILTIYTKIMSGKEMVVATSGMVGFAFGMTLMAGALLALGSIPFDTLAQGFVVLSGLLGIMVIYSKSMSDRELASAVKGITGFALGLAIMAGTLVILGKLPFDTLAQGSVVLVGLLSSIALFVKMTDGKDLAISGTSLIGFGVGLLALSGALVILSYLPFDTLVKGGIVIGTLMTGIAAFVNLTDGKDLAISASSMIAFAAGIAILAGVIAVLTALDTKAMLASTMAVSSLILTVGLFSKMSDLSSLAKAALGLGLFALALAALSVPIKMIADTPWDRLAATAVVIVAAIGSFALVAAIMPIFAAVGPLVGPALIGIAGVGAVITAIGLVVAAFGLMTKIPGFTDLINDGGKLLLSIGTALGSFVGGIVGGIGAGISSFLPQIGTDLSTFMSNLTPFINGSKLINADTANGVKYLAETILILTAANLLDSITSFFTGGKTDLSRFGKELSDFAPGFVSFANQIQYVKPEVVQASASAAKSLAAMASSVPALGGIMSAITGTHSLTVFGLELANFGPLFADYAYSISLIKPDVVIASANAAKSLAEMASSVPAIGGVLSAITGSHSLFVFGTELANFGPKFADYAYSISLIKPDVVIASANAAKTLTNMANSVPALGGIMSAITGTHSLFVFGTELANFGPKFADYAYSISLIKPDVVIASANAAQALVTMAAAIPAIGGIGSLFSGDNTMYTFGQQLVAFGTYLAKYYESIQKVSFTNLDASTSSLKYLIDTVKGINGINGNSVAAFSSNLYSIGSSAINSFIAAFTNSQPKVAQAANTLVDTFVNAARSKTSQIGSNFTALAQAGITALTNQQTAFFNAGSQLASFVGSGIKSQTVNAQTSFASLASSCISVLVFKFVDFYNTGKQFALNLASGAKDEGSLSFKSNIVSMVTMSLSAINTYYQDFYKSGRYLVTGFSNGISDYAYLAATQARAMALAATKAAKTQLDEHSPSKVGHQIGAYFGKGFVNGITEYVDVSRKVSSSMALSAREGLNQAISRIADFSSDDFGSQPTITPVLDFSSIKTGIGQINAMLSKSQVMSIGTTLDDGQTINAQNGSTQSGKSVNFKFEQNNYSPKALSRLDIYRDTKNQFSALKGVVDSI